MRNIKTYEDANKFNIDKAIKFIIKPWVGKLRLNTPVCYYQDKKIFIRLNRELDSSSFDDFSDFFGVLKKYNLPWLFHESSSTQSEFLILHKEIDKKLLMIEMSAEKFNL